MASHPLPPYPTTVHLSDRCCHGKIHIRRQGYGFTQTEFFHDQPIGRPPFIEVPIERSVTFYGEAVYSYKTYGLVGFISPTIEFLGEKGTYDLLDKLETLEFFQAKEAAAMLGHSARYLEKLRRQGTGPKFWRIADGCFVSSVWYELRDIEAYLEERKIRPERRGGRREHRKQKV